MTNASSASAEFDLASETDAVTNMVRIASEKSMEWFRKPLSVENKGSGSLAEPQVSRFDPVTEADVAVETELRSLLRSKFGDTQQILGEELGTSGSGRYRWVIDPIDGTRAFIAGSPLWGTLLGLQDGELPIAGWLHQPTLGHTYLATPERAELWEGDTVIPLATSDVESVSEAVLLSTHPDMFTGPSAVRYENLAASSRLSRFGGDCINYGYLASGFADLVVENQLQPYDIIPLVPIVERAGGVITGLDGGPVTNGGWAIAAATPALHAEALTFLNP